MSGFDGGTPGCGAFLLATALGTLAAWLIIVTVL